MVRKLAKTLFITAIALSVCSVVSAGELLANGGFEADGSLGWWGTPTGWGQNAYNHICTGTSTDAVSGIYSYTQCRYYAGSTSPVLYQTFSTTAGTFTVQGYCKTVEAGAAVRIRENKLGDAGSVRYWDDGSKSWVANSVAFGEAGGFYQGDTYGIGSNYSAWVGTSTSWTKFEFTVVALADVTSYTIDLGSPYFAHNGSNATYYTYWDNVSVSTVPEPGTMLTLLGLTSSFALVVRRKRS